VALVALNIATFFVNAIVCHGELARRRPAPAHLTAFYMWMSAGGMIGGIGAALIAPHVFSSLAEYPLLIVLAVLCRPARPQQSDERANWLWLLVPVLMVIGAVPAVVYGWEPDTDTYNAIVAGLVVLALLVSFALDDRLALAVVITAMFMVYRLYDADIRQRDS